MGWARRFAVVGSSTDHPRNHDGLYFSVLVTKTVAHPRPGSDDISRAYEEGWVGTNGYVRPDGSRQRRALAFQGQVVTHDSKTISEVFIVDLPANPPGGRGPLCSTETRRPAPPAGTAQRRLSFTASCKYPGLQGPRHWLRSAPDGSRIAFLMKDVRGIVQIHTVSPNGGPTNPTHVQQRIHRQFVHMEPGWQTPCPRNGLFRLPHCHRHRPNNPVDAALSSRRGAATGSLRIFSRWQKNCLCPPGRRGPTMVQSIVCPGVKKIMTLPILDFAVVIVYLAAMVAMGFYLGRKARRRTIT